MYKIINNGQNILSVDGRIIPVAEGNVDYHNYLEWVAEGNTPTPEFTFEEIQSNFKKEVTVVIQNHLDAFAQSKGYDSILSAVSYSGFINPFQAEAIQFFNWRTAVWLYAIQLLSDVTNNVRTVPTIETILSELPTFQ